MKKETGSARPSLPISILGLIAIIGVIVVGIKLNFGTQMAVFCGAVVAVIVAMLLGEKWPEIQDLLVEQINGVTVAMLQEKLAEHFNISFICVIPMLLVIALSILKVPAIIAMGGTAIVSVIFAVATQGASLSAIMGSAFNGYSSDTGVALIDTILNRGGAKSMVGTVYLVMFASIMSAAMKKSGILDVVIDKGVRPIIRSARSLVIVTMLESYLVLLLTGNQTMAIIIPGQTFADTYD